MTNLPLFRGVTKDKKVVYGYYVFKRGSHIIYLGREFAISEYEVDPYSIAIVVNLEEAWRDFNISYEQGRVKDTGIGLEIEDSIRRSEEVAYKQVLKTLKFASFWLPGLNDFTRGGDVADDVAGEENYELLLKNGKICVENRIAGSFLWGNTLEGFKVIGNAYLNPELLGKDINERN